MRQGEGVKTEKGSAIRALSVVFALWVGSSCVLADSFIDGRIGEAYGSTRAMDAGNDVTGDAECAGSAGRGNLMDFFAMSVPGSTGSTNDPWFFSWTVDSSFPLTDTTGNFFGNAGSNRVNYLLGIEVNCDGAPRLEMWQDGQAWEREFAWNVDYFIAMFATGTNTMEAQLWRNDGGNSRSFVVGGIAVTSQVVGFRRQFEFALPSVSPVPEVLRNNSSLCLYLLSVQDVEGSGKVLDGVGLLNHNINCQGPAFDLSSLGAVFINTDAHGKMGGRPTDPGVNNRQSLSYPNRADIASVSGQTCEPPFGISIDGQIDSAYTLLTEASFATPYAGGAANQSDFVGESSARTYTHMTNTIVLPGGQHGDIANLYTYADTNYLYVMVTGPTALGWELEPDLFNLFVAIDVPGKISNTDTGSTGDLAPGAANAPANRLVNFKGWDPDYVVELVWRGVNAGVDTPGNMYAANGSNGWNTTGTFLYQNIPNTAASPVGLYYSRTFPQYEFAIPWSALGRSSPPLTNETIRLGAYTTGDENVQSAGESRWDIADQSPGIGQGCSGEGCHERVGDDAFDDDALTSTGLGDRTPFVGRTYGAPGYAPATDSSTNDVDTIEEYFAFHVAVANCTPGIDIQKATNGQDADTAPGPVIGAGSQVVWTYTVTNTGNIALTNVFVYDDKIGAITNLSGGDLNNNKLLETNEVWTFTAAGSAQTGSYVNIGFVTGAVVGVGTILTDSDPSHYFGSTAGFTISKTRTIPLNRAAIPGESVFFEITVTNTGNVQLVTVPVTDVYEITYLAYQNAIPPSNDQVDDGVINWANIGPMNPGASTSILVHFTAVTSFSGSRTNTASTSPTPVSGHPPFTPQGAQAPYQISDTASFGDSVWNDLNANGIQETNEPGFAAVTVTLYDENTNVVASILTDAFGGYLFTNLVPGIYSVGFMPPVGYVFAPQDQGSDDLVDSDPDPVTGRTTPTLLSPGEQDVSWDAGLYARASVGDYVWLDININGIQDVNEVGLPGVPLTLYATNGAVIASTTSLVDGAYAFTNLAPGSYYIRVHIQPGTLLSPQYQGSDPELDNNFSPFTGLSDFFTLMSGETNRTIDAGLYDVPTLAQIDGVSGVLEGGRPVLTWETSLEYGTVGWFIEREATSGEWMRVSGSLPSAGDDLSGGRYAWPDENALPGGTYRYRIIEVEARGGWRPSDTYTITYPKASRHKNVTSDRSYRMEAIPPAQPDLSRPVAVTRAAATSAAANAVKVVVRESGLHAVAISDIAEVLGISASEVAADSIRADHVGLEIPVLREGSNVIFYARSYTSMYTDQNVYRITLDESKPLPVQSVAAASRPPVTEFTDTLHVERQLLLTASIFSDAADDVWLWRRLNSGVPNSSSYAAALNVSNLVPGTGGQLTVRLKGGSQSSGNGMHGVRVELNGQVLAAETFFGLDHHDMQLDVPAGIWHEGSNQVKIVMQPPTGVVNDLVYIDSFSATYRRALIAVSNRLEFSATSGPVRVGGFTHSAIKLWDVTDPWNPIQLTGYGVTADSGGWAVDFDAPRAGRYVASAAELIPAQRAAWQTHDLKDNTHRVDYLVIYGPGLRDGAEQLAADRASKGLRTKIVPVESVFDAFSHGIRDGRAIKTFLGYAYRQWETGPRYVVIAGDGSLDYQNRMGYQDCLVPTPPEGGPYGVYASDHAVGDINDDGELDVVVGRIPVTSPAQFSAYIRKLEAFEAGGSWRDSVLVATDNPDTGGDYLADGDALAAKMLNRMVNRADIGVIGAEAAESELHDGLSQGHELTTYIGHGTMLKLAEEGILTTNDVPNLNNTDKPGVLMALGCLMGVHGQPGMISIGEKLVISTNGSSATIASATLVNNRDGNTFGQLVVDDIYGAGTDRLGDAWVNAKNELVGNESHQVAKSYQLLGDPALAMGNANSPRGGPEVLPTRPAYSEWASWTFAPVWMDQGLEVNPQADFDGDGLTNWDEYVAGTDPLNENSDVVVVTVNPVSGGAVSLSWPSVPGRLYRIERSNSTGGDYVTLAEDITASAPLNTWLDTTADSLISFYRVFVK